MRGLFAILSLFFATGCSDCGARDIPPRGTREDSGRPQAHADAAEPLDGAESLDAGFYDALGGDAENEDALFFFDARAGDDAGRRDASSADLGSPDALAQDAMASDATVWPDASGFSDATREVDAAARPDASIQPDAASFPDAAVPGSGDIWVEIDYSNAYTPSSPGWELSATPGWGGAQWATTGKTWPEAWDRFNNMSVVDDPIGRSLEIGSSSELQLMIGLEELLAYDSATVRIEGRSRATSSSVHFDVYNPLNGCGASADLSNDWRVHVVELDLASCFLVGQGVQAVRVDPTSGTVALVRMRLTLHRARF